MINLDNFRICLLCSDTGKRARELLLFCSVARLYLTPCNPMDCSTPSSSVHYFWVHSNSCHLSLWCHPTISSSVAPFSSCPQSFPASVSFPVSQLFASGGQSIGASASASALVLPVNTQGLFPLGLTYLISLRPAAQALFQLWVFLVELGPGWWFSWR